MHTIEADYLVIGAGAMGMAFIDTLVSETEARVVVVDRNHAPGGHWTAAYPFVRLHQPSVFYGVNSLRLGRDPIDQAGWNKGLYELAIAGEVCSYDGHVMRQQLLTTGRVQYFRRANTSARAALPRGPGPTTPSPWRAASSMPPTCE